MLFIKYHFENVRFDWLFKAAFLERFIQLNWDGQMSYRSKFGNFADA